MDQLSDKILADFKLHMDKTVQHLIDQLRTIRTGRAAPALVEGVRVDYYGTSTPLNQIANISVPEARQLLIKPYDASILKEIERAILKSDLGLTPASDGKVLRLTLPPLSEEQRRKLSAKVKDLTEQSRVALRNERRDANKHADQAMKDGKLSDDQNKLLHEKVQNAIKDAEHRLDDVLKKKTHEIMED
jgi:ribosome recycling factor